VVPARPAAREELHVPSVTPRRTMPVMDTAVHDTLREQLEAERDRLRAELAEMGWGGQRMQFDEGFADSGQVTAERGEVEALAGSLVATLDDVEHALAKFASGDYGECERCGQEIGLPRLEANPAAQLCITCASKKR
jgi:RNA polymerase-binding transcription factor DksA